MSDKELRWKLIREEHLAQDRWIDFRKNVYELPDGQIIEPVYNYSKNSFALIVPTDEVGNYICVRQYRHGIDDVTTEFPAGAIEYLDKSDVPYITKDNTVASEEDAFEAAKRELEEETGYTSDEWKHLITLPANATLASNNVHIYAARNCKKVSDQHLDDSEFINVLLLSGDELRKLIFNGGFKQTHHILAWYLSKEQ